jgi:hypothetical protein
MAYSLAALVIVTNTFNVGADHGGMADAAHLCFRCPSMHGSSFLGLALSAYRSGCRTL